MKEKPLFVGKRRPTKSLVKRKNGEPSVSPSIGLGRIRFGGVNKAAIKLMKNICAV
jgi:hypothetical protein